MKCQKRKESDYKMEIKNIEICYRDKNADDRIVAWEVGSSEEEIKNLLDKHPSWYRSTYEM